ncbi:MAG: glycosyl transferase family 1 [Crocinitomicaceae bacterium]
MKKVLIITYRWPPAGGIGVLRCLKFAKYLRDFGWEPVILTAQNASYQFLDYDNLKEVPDGIEIHRVPIFEPINAFKKITGRKKEQPLQNITNNSTKKKSIIDKFGMWVRGNFFIPDARSAWIKPCIKYLDNYLVNNHIDAILTDGPPHTNTVIGMRVSQKHKIPWLADFQDPWTQVDYYTQLHIGRRADRIHRALEQEVFQTAKKITVASPSWKKDIESIGGRNVDVIYYGYDETDFAEFSAKEEDLFVIFHGGLLGADRNPETLFSVLSELINKYPEIGSRVKLKFAGEVDISVKNALKKHSLLEYTELMGMIPRKQVVKEYEKSSLLLLPINKAENAAGRIPGKLFEMLRTNKPILVLGPDDGDVKSIIEKENAGCSFDYENKQSLYDFMENSIVKNKFENFSSSANIQVYSNKMITGQIAKYLDGII